MAPISLPSATSGMPPREPMTPSIESWLGVPPLMPFSNSLVSRRNVAAARALCSETATEASWAPSMRAKATRLPPESTTAMFIFQSCLRHSAAAAAMTACACSSPIGAPYGTSNGILSGTTSSGLGGWSAARAGARAATAMAVASMAAFMFRSSLWRRCTAARGGWQRPASPGGGGMVK